jgi:transposase
VRLIAHKIKPPQIVGHEVKLDKVIKFNILSKIRRKFTKEFKLELVNRSLEEDVRLTNLCEDYEIHVNTLCRWRKEFLKNREARSFPGNGKEPLDDTQREIRRLKKQLQEAELERDILKKAIHVFSKKDGRYTNS